MVTQIGIHEHDVVVLASLKTVDVSGAEAELARTGSKHNLVCAIDSLQVLDAILGAIG